MSRLDLPSLPVPHKELAKHIDENSHLPVVELVQPYREYEAKLRQLYAQDSNNEALKGTNLNTLPIFRGHCGQINVRARDLTVETQQEKERYIMTLPEDQRRSNGSPAVVKSLKEFQHNFNIFSESSLVDLNWNNVVAAGSSVVSCLVPVPEEYNVTKRTLREFYHEKFCPASDVDLFLYGLTEGEAIEKIHEIERAVRDSILSETTTVRTKNAITICSKYPTRHVQIVLRIYKSVSEILTGFDIDCSGAAYDGKQVYCTPRALQSYITQINHIDLSRRSPSYENRLSKYCHRGFEVYWPDLERSRIDPTIFERSFQRTLGLARLLVLERLPTSSTRDQYLSRRRKERGRPSLSRLHFHHLPGNIKESHEDEIADWVDEEDVSNYHSFTIPYGPRYHAKKIEKLLYTKDLLLNAEWNQPKDRGVYLHRHPAFFGRFEDVKNDCCGFCPQAETDEEKEVQDQESKIYVFGNVSFLKDDPGRQQIGSFNPLTDDDWTEMAYVGNTARLCQDIVDGELDHVQSWLAQDGADPNTRDYTGRTPLHLAVMSSTPEVVKALVDHGARLIARLADGRTALHLAAERGHVEIVKILMDQSAANEAEEEEKQTRKRNAEAPKSDTSAADEEGSDASGDSDVDMVDDADADSDDEQSVVTGSFVNVQKRGDSPQHDDTVPEEDEDEPDFYDVNVTAWDAPCSAMHLAILCGHEDVVRLLCSEYGADILLPVKFLDGWRQPTAALLNLVLAAKLPLASAKSMVQTILSLGSTCAQADLHGMTSFHYLAMQNATELMALLIHIDQIGVKNSINHLAIPSDRITIWPLKKAVHYGNAKVVSQLLDAGALPQVDFETWLKSARQSRIAPRLRGYDENLKLFNSTVEQPIVLALESSDPSITLELIERGADVNSMPLRSIRVLQHGRHSQEGETVLDIIRRDLRRLRGWKYPSPTPPRLTHGMDEVLSTFQKGSWQYTVAKQAADTAKSSNERELKEYEKEKARIAGNDELQRRQDAIDAAVSLLEQIKSKVISKGGKTFKEIHPKFKTDEEDRRRHSRRFSKSSEFKVEFRFIGISDETEKRRAKYIELFEAAWAGDLDKIKALTLASWDPENNEPPLQVAVHDSMSNPFSLAYFRGHRDVATAILRIAQAQYAPTEKATSRYRMHTSEDGNSEDDMSDDSDVPQIYHEIVDDRFTVEDIGQVSMQVKSCITPLSMLSWDISVPYCKGGDIEWFSVDKAPLLQHLIQKNDRHGLEYYYNLVTSFAGQQKNDDDENDLTFAFPQWAFLRAIDRGHIEILKDMIRWTGAGLPLEQLVEKTGIKLQERPRYYQGLTVYGEKRNDWATAGRPVITRTRDIHVSPLLYASQQGNIDSVEFFLGDSPHRCYVEFGKSKAARGDIRIDHLNKSRGGLDGAVTRWLGSQNHLVIHAAIMGSNDGRAEQLVNYLIKACPESIEAKNVDGKTPLAVACWLGRLDLIKILIANGADQSIRDKHWNNIIHLAVANQPDAKQLRAFMQLLDPELRRYMLRSRSGIQTSDGRTPLHRWAADHEEWRKQIFGDDEKRDVNEELRALLEYSNGEELDVLDASGNTPLHTLISRLVDPDLIKIMVEVKPELLYRENAVGRTPVECAHDMYLRACVQNPPQFFHSEHWVEKRNPIKDLLEGKQITKEPSVDHDLFKIGQIYELVNAYLERFPSKRRLVSLHEANDVARRIGEEYQGQRYAWKGPGSKTGVRAGRAPEDEGVQGEKEGTEDQSEQTDFVSTELGAKAYGAWRKPQRFGSWPGSSSKPSDD